MPEIHLAFETVAKIRDISPGEMMYVEVGDEPVCLINVDGEYHALNDACTHEGASLAGGTVEGDEIECPLHGGAFAIRTGEATAMPCVVAVEKYRVRLVGDEVQVAVS